MSRSRIEHPAGVGRSPAISAPIILILLILSHPLGTLCHELAHGLAATCCGGKIERLEIYGLQLWPRLHWKGWSGSYGECESSGVSTPTHQAIEALAGAMSTWLVSVIAVALLWLRRWSRAAKTILVVLSLWWIDLLTYMLPSWGIRRSIFWGQNKISEPYDAAVALGIPGPAFQAFAIISCVLLAAALIARVTISPATHTQEPSQ